MVQGSQAGPPGPDDPFRRLFDRHGGEIFRFFVRRGYSAEDARDLTQETFLRVYRAMEGFRGEASARTWVFTIAQNLYRNRLRGEDAVKRQGEEVSYDSPSTAGEPDRPAADLPDPAAVDPLESTLAGERRQRLRRAIDALPDRMRQCVLLRVYQGRKYREIAEVLQVSIDTVKSQLHQAKERLRQAIGHDFHGWDDPDGSGGPT